MGVDHWDAGMGTARTENLCKATIAFPTKECEKPIPARNMTDPTALAVKDAGDQEA